MKNRKTNSQPLLSFIWKYLSLQKWKFIFMFLLSLVWSIDAMSFYYTAHTSKSYICEKVLDLASMNVEVK